MYHLHHLLSFSLQKNAFRLIKLKTRVIGQFKKLVTLCDDGGRNFTIEADVTFFDFKQSSIKEFNNVVSACDILGW